MICTYRVWQMESTFWRNLFSQSLLLNNWLLLVTTIGQSIYYPTYTYTTPALSYAHIGSGKWKPLFGATYLARFLLLNNWFLLVTTSTTSTTQLLLLLLLHYHMDIQSTANGSHFLAQPIQLEFTSKQMVTTGYYNWLLLLLHF